MLNVQVKSSYLVGKFLTFIANFSRFHSLKSHRLRKSTKIGQFFKKSDKNHIMMTKMTL